MSTQQSKDHKLYVLVEGEPESPETTFFSLAMEKIWKRQHLKWQYDIVEVGGSSEFRAFAKVSYRLSEIHQTVPVLAIADSDYRIQSTKKQNDNSKLIKQQTPKILYWPRHEWENYLLEETKWLADWINEIPVKHDQGNRISTMKKFYKTSTTLADPQQLDNFLEKYFRQQLKDEYWECLKFNLTPQIKNYPSVKKQGFDDAKTFSERKLWFNGEASRSEDTVTLKPKPDTLFDNIMKELPWETWLVQPDLLPFELAKQRFRGKEAFEKLGKFIKQEFAIHNFDHKLLTRELLKHLASNVSSAIFLDLQNLLLPELS